MIKKNYSEFVKRIEKSQKDFKETVIKDLKELITKAFEKESLKSIDFNFDFDDGWWFSCDLKIKDYKYIQGNGDFDGIYFDTDDTFDDEDFPIVNKRPYTKEICEILNKLFAANENPQCLINLGFYKADKTGFHYKHFEKQEWKEGWE